MGKKAVEEYLLGSQAIIYEGNWINGKRTGNGVMSMSDGEKWAVKILSLTN